MELTPAAAPATDEAGRLESRESSEGGGRSLLLPEGDEGVEEEEEEGDDEGKGGLRPCACLLPRSAVRTACSCFFTISYVENWGGTGGREVSGIAS